LPRTLRILDIDVDAVTLAESVDLVCQAVDSHRGHGQEVFQVATVNPEFIMLARRDENFRQLLGRCQLRTADGVGLQLAARLLGGRLPQRVTGVDLVLGIAAAAARRGDRLFLLGAAHGVASAAAERLRQLHPSLQVVGALSGEPGEEGDAESLAAVRESRADIVLVAYGAPLQERWAARNLTVSGAAVAIGVGGTFDYLSGRVRRAPALMRRLGLEWLYRLARQPWRARRMSVLPVFLLLVLMQRLRRA